MRSFGVYLSSFPFVICPVFFCLIVKITTLFSTSSPLCNGKNPSYVDAKLYESIVYVDTSGLSVWQ